MANFTKGRHRMRKAPGSKKMHTISTFASESSHRAAPQNVRSHVFSFCTCHVVRGSGIAFSILSLERAQECPELSSPPTGSVKLDITSPTTP
jgi:hypothetical protein